MYSRRRPRTSGPGDVRKRVYLRFTSSPLSSRVSLGRPLPSFAECLICFHQHVIPLYAERFACLSASALLMSRSHGRRSVWYDNVDKWRNCRWAGGQREPVGRYKASATTRIRDNLYPTRLSLETSGKAAGRGREGTSVFSLFILLMAS